jgi:hypothetical protein
VSRPRPSAQDALAAGLPSNARGKRTAFGAAVYHPSAVLAGSHNAELATNPATLWAASRTELRLAFAWTSTRLKRNFNSGYSISSADSRNRLIL